ncbi:MAG: hypothetical protein AAGM22_06555 [Acidobacteriota bacterium]
MDTTAHTLSQALAGLFFVIFAAFGAPRASAEGLKLDRVGWDALEYRASKLLVTAEADVTLEAKGSEVLLTLGSEVLGRRSETRLWVDAATGRSVREERLKLHREAELRAYVYKPDHALKIRYRERPSAQGRAPIESWIEKSQQRQPFGTPGEPLPVDVTTPSALLYLLAASPLEARGDLFEAPIFADEKLVTARAEVVEVISYSGEIAMRGGGVHRPGDTLRIALTGRDPAGGAVDLGLLGLEGDLEILVERGTRLPLAIRGAMPVVGTLDVKLRAASLTN